MWQTRYCHITWESHHEDYHFFNLTSAGSKPRGKKLRSSLRLKTPATLHAKLEIMFDFQKYTFRGSIWKLAMLNLREIFKRWSDWPGNLRSLRFAPRCFGIRFESGYPLRIPILSIIRGSMRNPNHQTPQNHQHPPTTWRLRCRAFDDILVHGDQPWPWFQGGLGVSGLEPAKVMLPSEGSGSKQVLLRGGGPGH